MIKKIAVSLVISIFLLFYGCAGIQKAEIIEYKGPSIVWPSPPEKSRIKYLYSIWNLEAEGETFGDKVRAFWMGGGELDDITMSPTLVRPFGLYVDDKRLYITDTVALRVTVIDLKTREVLNIGREDGEGRLEYPIAAVSDKSGNIYVSDVGKNLVLIYDEKGNYKNKLEGFKRPTGIGINQQKGLLYIIDTVENVVHVYDTKGTLQHEFGGNGESEGQFNYPTHIHVDENGFVYIVDSMNARVQIFDEQGNFISAFGSRSNAAGDFSKPKGISVDKEGHIYVVDAEFDNVQIFDRKGRILTFFGEAGTDAGAFWLPSGIAIDRFNRVYVADTYNRRIQVFQFLGGD